MCGQWTYQHRDAGVVKRVPPPLRCCGVRGARGFMPSPSTANACVRAFPSTILATFNTSVAETRTLHYFIFHALKEWRHGVLMDMVRRTVRRSEHGADFGENLRHAKTR